MSSFSGVEPAKNLFFLRDIILKRIGVCSIPTEKCGSCGPASDQ